MDSHAMVFGSTKRINADRPNLGSISASRPVDSTVRATLLIPRLLSASDYPEPVFRQAQLETRRPAEKGYDPVPGHI
jgi:hypothetical protein